MAKTQPEDIGEGLDTGQFLTFILSGEEFAISIMRVTEIIEYRDLTNVPKVPSFISAAINLRDPLAGHGPKPRVRCAIRDLAARLYGQGDEADEKGGSKQAGGLLSKIFAD